MLVCSGHTAPQGYEMPFGINIRTVARVGLDNELHKLFKRLKPGIVLDAGSRDSPYKKYISHTKYMRLDIDEKNNPDICCDVHEIKWHSDYFDTVIATEVLEHLHTPQNAVDEIRRVLKSGGVCIASVPFIYPYHGAPKDYYRFTPDSLANMFKNFKKVEIIPHGNRLQVVWQMISLGKLRLLFDVFSPLVAKIFPADAMFAIGFIVYAEK